MNLPSGRLSETGDPVSAFFRIAVVVALIAATIYVLMPFFGMLLWAVVLGIALYPVQQVLEQRYRMRKGRAALMLIVLLSLVLIVPSAWLLFTTAESVAGYMSTLDVGALAIPPPDERIRNWPLIGETAYTVWLQASSDLSGLLARFKGPIGKWLLQIAGIAGNAAADLLYFFFSLVVSGVFLAYGRELGITGKATLRKLSSDRFHEIADLIVTTIRSTVKGVMVVAVVQALLAGGAFVVTGIPLAGIWTVICLLLALVQIGILPVALITCIYAWIQFDTLPATFFTVWMLFIGIVDNLMRPWLMGKDTKVPAGIVFIGSLGGLLTMGFIGLFIGAVLLSVVHRLFLDWIRDPEPR
ncbi:MAG: AI-2E family transporter [Sphingobacteriales bacterium]|jgi:predicted PurR-regulated permease PerM|nr:AI-2E family transporter [Sphingobacteriales bacterium]